jgi:RsiW-degrading membrane proteinase PrsW (M82 family)
MIHTILLSTTDQGPLGIIFTQIFGAIFALFLITLVLALMTALYFLPAIIARARRKPNSGKVFILNLLLGWTAVGWGAALAWALVDEQ